MQHLHVITDSLIMSPEKLIIYMFLKYTKVARHVKIKYSKIFRSEAMWCIAVLPEKKSHEATWDFQDEHVETLVHL